MIELSILHLEDNPADAELVLLSLLRAGFESTVTRVEERTAFQHHLDKGGYDVIFADYNLPAFDGVTALTMAQETRPDIPFIFVSGEIGEERAIESLKNGATDYVLKHRLNRMVPALKRALQEVAERRRRRVAEMELAEKAEALRRSNEELRRSNEDLKQFAYVASHDLQQPLRTMKNFADRLQQNYRGRLDEKADKYLHFIVDGANRMSGLVNDLLEYSRVGSAHRLYETVDMEEVLASARKNLTGVIHERQPEITCDTMPEIIGVASLLTQVFQNLIGNAIKFCLDRRPRIHISVEEREDAWLFSVKDNGIGIEPDFLEQIFAIFQRLHTRTEFGGNGIGLSLCRRIVELHDGKIWAESEPGTGSVFCFTLSKCAESHHKTTVSGQISKEPVAKRLIQEEPA